MILRPPSHRGVCGSLACSLLLGLLLLPHSSWAEEASSPPAPEAQTEEALAAEAEAWVVLQLSDGTTLSGVVVSEGTDHLLVRSGTLEITVPREHVEHEVRGALGPQGAVQDAALASPAAGSASSSEGPSSGYPDPQLFEEYRGRRLQLVDRRGRAIGPAAIGYTGADFGSYNGKRFHAVVGSARSPKLSYPEFLDLVDVPELHERWNRSLAAAKQRSTAGGVLLGIGAGLLTGVAVIGATAFNVGFDQDPFLAFPPMIIGGSVALALGTTFSISGTLRQKRLRGRSLDYIYDRDEAWKGVQQHNAELRRGLGLPDDEGLDGPQ